MDANAIKTATEAAMARYTAASTAALDAEITLNRLALAEMIAEADLPAGAVVEVMDWADEPNGDGTYDLDLMDAYDTDGNIVASDIGGNGAIRAGRYDDKDATSTDWDIFTADNDEQISVDRVYEWVRAEGWNAPAVG